MIASPKRTTNIVPKSNIGPNGIRLVFVVLPLRRSGRTIIVPITEAKNTTNTAFRGLPAGRPSKNGNPVVCCKRPRLTHVDLCVDTRRRYGG